MRITSALLAVLLTIAQGAVAESAAVISWAELDPVEQRILGKAQANWNEFSTERQQKLISGARRWQAMSRADRQNMRRNMADLEQMEPARLRKAFQGFKKLPPERRRELRHQWRNKNPSERHELRCEWNRKKRARRSDAQNHEQVRPQSSNRETRSKRDGARPRRQESTPRGGVAA